MRLFLFISVITSFCLGEGLFSSLFSSPSLSSLTSPCLRALNLKVDYDKRVVQSNLKQDVLKTLLHLKGFSKDKKENESNPVSSVVVIDKSGSMDAAGKMTFAVEGARTLVDLLNDNDTVGVVVFDSSARVLFNVDYATKENKAKIHKILSEITSFGMTNMYDGLKLGINMLLAPPNPKNKERKSKTKQIILLSDGLPQQKNHLSDLVADAHLEGITISSIGLGLDYDERLMQEIAVRGGGNYYYVRESEFLPNVFTAELGHGRRTITRNTQAFFVYNPHLVAMIDVVGHHTYAAKKEDAERIRKLLKEKDREGREEHDQQQKQNTDGEEKDSEGKTVLKRKWEDVSHQELEVMGIEIRDFIAEEERDMLVFLNYTTVLSGNRSENKNVMIQPFVLPLGTLVVTYMMEDAHRSSNTSSSTYTKEGSAVLGVEVVVDDDQQRATQANGAAEAVEQQRRVGLMVELDQANRVHLDAMNLMNNGHYDKAEGIVKDYTIKLGQSHREWEQIIAGSSPMSSATYNNYANEVRKQEERFANSLGLMNEGRQNRHVRERMSKASAHVRYERATSSRASMHSRRNKGDLEL